MTSLRERQKEDRSKRIAAAARALFVQKGYELATIEGIAELAGVSGVTVHNYYGTKAGILLALVVESDQAMVERMEKELPDCPSDIAEATLAFARILLDHAMAYLEKPIWRQVMSAVTLAAGTQLASDYAELDRRLAALLAERARAMQAAGLLSQEIDADDLGSALFLIVNARFIDFIKDEDCSMAAAEALVAADLVALRALTG